MMPRGTCCSRSCCEGGPQPRGCSGSSVRASGPLSGPLTQKGCRMSQVLSSGHTRGSPAELGEMHRARLQTNQGRVGRGEEQNLEFSKVSPTPSSPSPWKQPSVFCLSEPEAGGTFCKWNQTGFFLCDWRISLSSVLPAGPCCDTCQNSFLSLSNISLSVTHCILFFCSPVWDTWLASSTLSFILQILTRGLQQAPRQARG